METHTKNGMENGNSGFDSMHKSGSGENALADESRLKPADMDLFMDAKSATKTLGSRTLVLGNVPSNYDVHSVMKQMEKDFGMVLRVYKPKPHANIYFVFFTKHERAKIAEKAMASDIRFFGNSGAVCRICPEDVPLTCGQASELLGSHISGFKGGFGDVEGNGRGNSKSLSLGRNASMRLNDGPGYRQGPGQQSNYSDNYPTRLLVNSDLVGAVIGRGGEKIKEITSATTARVDVKRELVPWSQFGNSSGGPGMGGRGGGPQGRGGPGGEMSEQSQIVFIKGNMESCSHAVRLIMDICHQEAAENDKHDLNLGLLAEDRFCGRVIGRDGKHLKQIKEKSGTTIAISNSPTITALSMEPKVFSLDRIVTIRGSLESMCEAEKYISDKLRNCDMVEKERANQPYMPPGMMPPNGPGGYGAPYGNNFEHNGMMGMHNPNSEYKMDDALYMRIPHVSAGAVIGTDGASIKKIMEETKTYVNVSKVKPDERQGDRQVDSTQRLVTIKGPGICQTKAQWAIFQRVKNSSRQSEFDIPLQDHDVSLWSVIRVPRQLVGRIIGKGGKIVSHIQSNTGTIINMPQDESSTDLQSVEVYGSFDSTQLALSRIRALIQQAIHQQEPSMGMRGGGGGFRGGPGHFFNNDQQGPGNKHFMGRPRRRSGPPRINDDNDECPRFM